MSDPVPATPPRTPSVTVLLVNLNGVEHLPQCLESIASQDYPSDLVDVILVDNASTDGSRELLASRYPYVKVIARESNVGFAPAVNLAAKESRAECIALVNNDSRLAPDWISQIVALYEPGEGYQCVAGTILDWEGTHVDFHEGVINFYGMADQLGFQAPISAVEIEDGRDLAFACGGAMLCNREVFLEAGGFDPDFFAYFEDVDFGWRLWLLGHKIRLAARALSYHHHHGTSSRFPVHQRFILFERNSLRMIIKNYDDENLSRVLGPALLLTCYRGTIESNSLRDNFDIGAEDTATVEPVERIGMSRFHAVTDIVDDLDTLMEARRRLQAKRRRTDAEVFELFGEPFRPLACGRPEYLDAMHKVVSAFRLDDMFTQARASSVLFVGYDKLGKRMAGPAIRCWELAKVVSRHVSVTVASPDPIEHAWEGIETIHFRTPEQLEELVQEFDVVVIYGYTLHLFPFLREVPGVLVADMVTPWVLENLEVLRDEPDSFADPDIRLAEHSQADLVETADFIMCASERQRDYWMGMLTSLGRVDRGVHANDSRLRSLIDVVPFGCPDEPFPPMTELHRDLDSRIGDDDVVIMWIGGTWSWFDPLTVLDAFEELHRRDPAAKLVFLGLQLERPGVPEMDTVVALRDRLASGAFGDSVIVVPWVAYDERLAWLGRADIAVYAADDVAEVRFAFRTRLLDHLYAAIPTVCTEGDYLGDLIAEAGGGITVSPGDSKAMADALERLTSDEALRKQFSENLKGIADQFRWSVVAEPLVAVSREPWRWRATKSVRPHRVALTQDASALLRKRRERIEELETRMRRYMPVEKLLHRLVDTPVYSAYKWAKAKARSGTAKAR